MAKKFFYCYKNLISNLCGVNNSAKHGVKLCSDFVGIAKKENKFQDIVQAVENKRNMLPNQRKRPLDRFDEVSRGFLNLRYFKL